MNLEEAKQVLKDNGYLTVLTHSEEIQKQATAILARRLDKHELESVVNYIETVSDKTLGVNMITIDAAISLTINRKQEQPRIHQFFDRLRALGLGEIFNWERMEAGTLIQHYTIVAPQDKQLPIIVMSKGRDIFYLYTSPSSEQMEDMVELIKSNI